MDGADTPRASYLSKMVACVAGWLRKTKDGERLHAID